MKDLIVECNDTMSTIDILFKMLQATVGTGVWYCKEVCKYYNDLKSDTSLCPSEIKGTFSRVCAGAILETMKEDPVKLKAFCEKRIR